jgi:hypothetical protein
MQGPCPCALAWVAHRHTHTPCPCALGWVRLARCRGRRPGAPGGGGCGSGGHWHGGMCQECGSGCAPVRLCGCLGAPVGTCLIHLCAYWCLAALLAPVCELARSAEDDVNSIGKPTVAVVTIIVALEGKELPKVGASRFRHAFACCRVRTWTDGR